MKTTHYDIQVDPADLLADADVIELSGIDDVVDPDEPLAAPRHMSSTSVPCTSNDATLSTTPSVLSVIDADDLDWVARLIDIVVACRGQPWRIALEQLDRSERPQYLDRLIPPHHFAAAIGALQRVLGGRGQKAQLARACREIVLGHPALTSASRLDRIAAAARALELRCDEVERVLWADLPRERPVELPFGRPSELEVAAFANVQLIQRAVRRAHTLTISVVGDAGPLVRGAASRGLLTTVYAERAPAATDVVENGPSCAPITVIEVVGPLALCHRTAVYGRAIASLVPLLAECGAFRLTLTASGVAGPYRTQLESPVLLPMLPVKMTTSWSLASRLARNLRRELPGADVTIAPPPILANRSYVCPDIAIDRGRLYIEIVGFWTAAYLERKRALYAAAGLDVVLCVDEARGCAEDPMPSDVVSFTRTIDVEPIVARFRQVA